MKICRSILGNWRMNKWFWPAIILFRHSKILQVLFFPSLKYPCGDIYFMNTGSTRAKWDKVNQSEQVLINLKMLLSCFQDLGTNLGLLMWDESSKLHYFIDFWHSLRWRPWMLLLTKSNFFKFIIKMIIHIQMLVFLLLYKILSDCHYVDEINDLLNAFRWKKIMNTHYIQVVMLRSQRCIYACWHHRSFKVTAE